MSEGALLRELEELRAEVRTLVFRVTALEAQLLVRNTTTGSPVTVNYSVAAGNLPEVPPLPGTTSFTSPPRVSPQSAPPTVSASSSGAPTGRRAGDYTEEERTAIAQEVGLFLQRSLAGDHRGESGRSRLQLSSRFYILCRDIRGRVYNPVQIHRSFGSIKPLVKDGGACGNSIFVGFPTLWEAKVCVRTAGLQWPADE